jgi:hypothetical protein
LAPVKSPEWSWRWRCLTAGPSPTSWRCTGSNRCRLPSLARMSSLRHDEQCGTVVVAVMMPQAPCKSLHRT